MQRLHGGVPLAGARHQPPVDLRRIGLRRCPLRHPIVVRLLVVAPCRLGP